MTTKYTKGSEAVETMGRGRFSICRPADGFKALGCSWYVTDNAKSCAYLHNDGTIKHSAVRDGSQAWYKSRQAARDTIALYLRKQNEEKSPKG